VVGRKVTLEECEFIFKRIWGATLECQKDAHSKTFDDVEHVNMDDMGGERDPTEVHLNEFFGIIDLAGKLMNKKEPDSDDEGPYDEF
jgi:hypothetical protein